MKIKISPWIGALAALFVLYFLLAYGIPPHDVHYNVYGGQAITGGTADLSRLLSGSGGLVYMANAVLLQWQEFHVLHGRFVSHILLRWSMGMPFFWGALVHAAVALFIYLAGVFLAIPPKIKGLRLFGLAFYVFLFSVALSRFYLAFFASPPYYYAAFWSSFFATALILAFFIPYLRLFTGAPLSPKIWQVALLGLAAGNAHEIGAAGIPMMLLVYFLCRLRKIPVPLWFWWGFGAYCIGFIPHIPRESLAGNNRLLIYGNGGKDWQFFGQSYDWLALGWKRYPYTFIRHMFTSVTPWYEGPGWLPSTWHFNLIFWTFWGFTFKKIKNFWDEACLIPLLIYGLSFGMVSVMMFSPKMHWQTIDQLKVPLFAAMVSAAGYWFHTYNFARTQKILTVLFLAVPFILGCFFIPPLYRSKKEFLQWRSGLIEASQKGLASYEGPAKIEPLLFGEPIHSFALEASFAKYGITNYTATD